uniref:C-type lectin domain-containing protein n=1 Tax=Myripristis murdjan TaxID=586833 RepID=A0A667X6F7_9TELE
VGGVPRSHLCSLHLHHTDASSLLPGLRCRSAGEERQKDRDSLHLCILHKRGKHYLFRHELLCMQESLFKVRLGSLPSCFPRQYLLVEEKMNWTEAQSYCRQHYTDLATVTSEEDVTKLNDAVGSHRCWIGLYEDINSWRWSLQNKSYYGEGEAEFRMWVSGQPDNSGSNEHCVVMNPGGLWFVSSCFSARPFVCYNGENKTTAVNS